jgi:cytochrome d ubiquinol oxidase subunit II
VTLELAAAGAMLVALVVYALTGGADFGGGIWDLLATGPRAAAQRRAIERAIAPVWEANHVWLIFVVVVLFTAFPPAFARLGTDLHVPLTLMLVGIVLRGSAFVFRQYGGGTHNVAWSRVFAISSVIAPLMLGCVLGTMTTGHAWWRPLPIVVGLLALAAFAFLAAVYLTREVDDADLRADFTKRARLSANVVAIAGIVVALLAHTNGTRFGERLVGSTWSIPLGLGAAATLAGTLALLARSPRLARMCAVATIALLVLGWGLAQYPMLIAPDLTVDNAAAPHATLRALMPIVIGGAVILAPSLWWMLRVFKR